jgi:hypothetical protein|tara:strand:+ start:311 stop:787 length:477 start_codon:yes stop_codon:yes gene_type:complete
MQKNKQIGVIVDDLSASQLSYYLIKNINEFLEDGLDDFVVFFENATSSIVSPEFSVMAINEIWNFEGVLISTSISNTLSMLKSFSPERKIFYVWDLEWLRRHGKEFENTVKAFTDSEVTLIARSKEHALAIENYCNIKIKHIVEDFNIKKLIRIINDE